MNNCREGRIERLFETLQDRLVKEMRLAGIDSLEAANHFLETRFLLEWEKRFTVAPRTPRNAHRRMGREHRLEEILSVRVARQVADDHTVSWDGDRWGVPREEICAGLRGAQVEIERRLDGWGAGGNRTATGRLPLAALPEPLSAPAPLPETGAARGKSFRPTASSPYRKTTIKSLQKCSSEPSMADISIWQKTGHFYFALTDSI